MTRKDELKAFIEHIKRQHAQELNLKQEEISSLVEELKTVRYALKGACQEHLHVKYEISPHMLDSISFREKEFIDKLTNNTINKLACRIEEKIGNRYKLEKEYSAALKYIYYIQSHAQAFGLHFAPFNQQ